MVMSFSHVGSSIRAFVTFRQFRRAITFVAFGLLHRVTLTPSSRLGSRKHILLVSNATLNEKSNQSMKPTTLLHVYEVRPRKDHRGVDLISDVLPFGRLLYDTPNNAIGYAQFFSRSHDAVIRVYEIW